MKRIKQLFFIFKLQLTLFNNLSNRRIFMQENIPPIHRHIQLQIKHKDKITKNRKVKVWTSQQDQLLLKLYQKYPKQWSEIATLIPNRNQNQCLHRYRRLSQNGLIIHKIWSQQEDSLVKKLMKKVGKNWKVLAEMIGTKTGKQIRERYINKLDPKIKKQEWNQQQDMKLIQLYKIIGSKWSQIAKKLPGRPENMIKNRFYSYIKKNYEFSQKVVQNLNSQKQVNAITSMENIGFQKQNSMNQEINYQKQCNKKMPTSFHQIQSYQILNLNNRQPFSILNNNRDSALQIKTYNNIAEADCFIYLGNSFQ